MCNSLFVPWHRPSRKSTIALALLLSGCQTAGDASSPTVPDGFVFRPSFQTTRGEARAGTAFLVRLPDQPRSLLISAIHLLGPAGGMRESIPSEDVAKALVDVRLVGCFDGADNGQIGGEALTLPAAMLGTASKAGDILAVWASDQPILHPGRLAASAPEPGRPVWLAASVPRGAPAEQRLHRAVSKGFDKEGNFLYEYDNPDLILATTSGAPVLNNAGEVVAINVGGKKESDRLVGIGNPVDRFRSYLDAATKKTD